LGVKPPIVYLDTSVLANWILNYQYRPRDIRPEKKAKECIELLDRIQEGEFICRFETSTWAMAELSQTISDNIVAFKILRDGFSLVYFDKLKEDYPLESSEQNRLQMHLREFRSFLVSKNIRIVESRISDPTIIGLSCKYSLSTPDAAHVAQASSRKCNYLVTIDPDMTEAEPPITEVTIVKPSTLYVHKELRQQERG